MKGSIQLDELYTIRCIIKKENGEYLEGRDYNNKKYIILNNEASKNLKLNSDVYFYATKEERGVLFKKQVYIPLKKEEYEHLIKDISQEYAQEN